MRRAATRLLRLYSHLASAPIEPRLRMPSIPNGEPNGRSAWEGVTLADLPKSHTFTANLPPDPVIPSPEASKEASKQHLRVSRPVKSAVFTWVAPENNENPQLLATSWKALRDVGLKADEAETEDFRALMSGNKIYEEHYPWGKCHLDITNSAQNYGGWQFGVWASQLGDG